MALFLEFVRASTECCRCTIGEGSVGVSFGDFLLSFKERWLATSCLFQVTRSTNLVAFLGTSGAELLNGFLHIVGGVRDCVGDAFSGGSCGGGSHYLPAEKERSAARSKTEWYEMEGIHDVSLEKCGFKGERWE